MRGHLGEPGHREGDRSGQSAARAPAAQAQKAAQPGSRQGLPPPRLRRASARQGHRPAHRADQESAHARAARWAHHAP